MLPTDKTSKARKRKRRSHHALRAVNYSICPRCNEAKLPHAACSNCGYVNKSLSIKVESES